MKSVILEKISRELNSGIDNEAKTLYLLVEIKKIRDLDDPDREKTILDFYRDWAAHSELGYDKTTKGLLGRFEPYIKDNISARNIATDFGKHEPDFFKLKDLKTELKEFLSENKLPCKLIENEGCWYTFVKELLKILKECSIKPSVGEIKELSLEEDNNGNTSFKFRLENRRDCPIVKLKWKNK